MLDFGHLKNVLHANGVTETTPEAEFRRFLKDLNFTEKEITEAVKYFKKKAWFVISSPNEQVAKQKASLVFKIREKTNYLVEKVKGSHVYIDEPLDRPPVFNTMKSHLMATKKVVPQVPKIAPATKYKTKKSIVATLNVLLIGGILFLAYTFRAEIYFSYRYIVDLLPYL